MVVIEVDGPSHDAASSARRLRTRLLRALGFALVAVPYREWEALIGPHAQADYLADKLAPHCPPSFSLAPATLANPRGRL
ncbi:hypothetical protein T492DRAFT_492078 [Pavlovales sp. CCMP2436]|nr:hypothetical protein T492DRAFT_492078 [Pavlovales sp. CCMP2436]|mmetsp:Transcript_9045/g.21806  ORF Transcript_9045/g.21806 Transcript_9045/m.21806 type:complete len:80 (+) Transcript_9045:2796-3035(+)